MSHAPAFRSLSVETPSMYYRPHAIACVNHGICAGVVTGC